MNKKLLRQIAVMVIYVSLLLALVSGEVVPKSIYVASFNRESSHGAVTYTVKVNGEEVFSLPEDLEGHHENVMEQAMNVAAELNTVLRSSDGSISVKPYLIEEQVVIKVDEIPIISIDERYAENLELTTSEVALQWTDRLEQVLVKDNYAAARKMIQRGSTRLLEGRASWYGGSFNGRRTASGEVFDEDLLTAAHKTLPFGTVILVTNVYNDLSVIVKINDRGPYSAGRIVDLSKRAATEIGMIRSGTAPVRIEILTSHAMDLLDDSHQ